MKNGAITTLHYQSPCGLLVLGAFGGRLCLCDWPVEPHHTRVLSRLLRANSTARPTESGCAYKEKENTDILTAATQQLNEYFSGVRRNFTLPLLFPGTPFQRTVWEELLRIPYGATLSYSSLARNLGRPQSVRAVANAVGSNALSLFVPCHRVLGTDGSLTGYAGGLPAKHFLLALEEKVISAAK